MKNFFEEKQKSNSFMKEIESEIVDEAELQERIKILSEFLKHGKIWKILSFILYTSLLCSMFFPSSIIYLVFTCIPVGLFAIRISLIILLNNFEFDAEELKCINRKYIKKEIPKVFKEILLFIPFLLLTSFILSFFVSGNSQNQAEVIETLNNGLLYFFLSTVVMAPILEEMLFRLLPYQFIKNKYLYILIASLVFAGIHVIGDPNPFYYIWIYLFPSIYLTYRFYKTKDVVVTISLHMFNNLVSFLLLIF